MFGLFKKPQPKVSELSYLKSLFNKPLKNIKASKLENGNVLKFEFNTSSEAYFVKTSSLKGHVYMLNTFMDPEFLWEYLDKKIQVNLAKEFNLNYKNINSLKDIISQSDAQISLNQILVSISKLMKNNLFTLIGAPYMETSGLYDIWIFDDSFD